MLPWNHIEIARKAMEETIRMPGPPAAEIRRIERHLSRLYLVVGKPGGPDLTWEVRPRAFDSIAACRRCILHGTGLLLPAHNFEVDPPRKQIPSWLAIVEAALERGRKA